MTLFGEFLLIPTHRFRSPDIHRELWWKKTSFCQIFHTSKHFHCRCVFIPRHIPERRHITWYTLPHKPIWKEAITKADHIISLIEALIKSSLKELVFSSVEKTFHALIDPESNEFVICEC